MKKLIPDDAVLIPDHAKCVFRGKIFDVYQWPQEMFDGSTATFEMLKRPDTVEIIAIKDGKIVIQEEEQPNRAPHITIPAGRHDVPGESILQAAQRELSEETGLQFKQWKLLNVVQPFSKSEWFIYQYLATDLLREEKHRPEADGEKITVMEKSLTEVKELIKHPKNRFLPKQLLENISSVDELLLLPEFQGKK